MIRPLSTLVALALALSACGDSGPANAPAAPANGSAAANSSAPAPVPDTARVRLETDAGAIVLELNGRRAPVTTANFLAYVDQHRFDGVTFYRASRTPRRAGQGFIQENALNVANLDV
jgi:peptidyl-prolyl cis-trans isomerase A (cyclophilin A)